MASAQLRFTASVYPPGTRHPPHSHDELSLSVVLRGRIAEQAGERTEYAGALSVVVKDPSVTHADAFGSEESVLARLVAPGQSFARLVAQGEDAPAWRWSHDPAVAAPFLRLVRRAADGETSFASDDTDVVELLAGLAPHGPAPRGEPPAWLKTALEEIRDGPPAAVSVRELARGAGVHPVYLARAMRRWYDISPGEELRRARLRRAAERAAQPSPSLSAVAHLSGFSDEPHLCRSFGDAAGLTPGRYRRLVSRIQGIAHRSA